MVIDSVSTLEQKPSIPWFQLIEDSLSCDLVMVAIHCNADNGSWRIA